MPEFTEPRRMALDLQAISAARPGTTARYTRLAEEFKIRAWSAANSFLLSNLFFAASILTVGAAPAIIAGVTGRQWVQFEPNRLPPQASKNETPSIAMPIPNVLSCQQNSLHVRFPRILAHARGFLSKVSLRLGHRSLGGQSVR